MDAAAENTPDITLILHRWGEGDKNAIDELIPMVYGDLRAVARSYLKRESSDHTLQGTALVNEVYLRLMKNQNQLTFNDREHFFRTATLMMRRMLTDHARSKGSARRGKSLKDTLEEESIFDGIRTLDPETLITLDNALGRLENRFPRQAQLVQLRIFLGMNIDEAADAMDISRNTVKREWNQAKKRLFLELNRT